MLDFRGSSPYASSQGGMPYLDPSFGTSGQKLNLFRSPLTRAEGFGSSGYGGDAYGGPARLVKEIYHPTRYVPAQPPYYRHDDTPYSREDYRRPGHGKPGYSHKPGHGGNPTQLLMIILLALLGGKGFGGGGLGSLFGGLGGARSVNVIRGHGGRGGNHILNNTVSTGGGGGRRVGHSGGGNHVSRPSRYHEADTRRGGGAQTVNSIQDDAEGDGDNTILNNTITAQGDVHAVNVKGDIIYNDHRVFILPNGKLWSPGEPPEDGIPGPPPPPPELDDEGGIPQYDYDDDFRWPQYDDDFPIPDPFPGPEPFPDDPDVNNAGQQGRIHGDPHIVGFDDLNRENFDFHGEVLQRKQAIVYSALTDEDVKVNTKLIPWEKNTTVVGEIGIQLGNDRILMDGKAAPKLNNRAMTVNELYRLDKGTARWDGSKLKVDSSEYNMVFDQNGGIIPDITMTIGPNGNRKDGVRARGYLGDTDGITPIDGTKLKAADYEVAGGDLFGDPQNPEVNNFRKKERWYEEQEEMTYEDADLDPALLDEEDPVPTQPFLKRRRAARQEDTTGTAADRKESVGLDDDVDAADTDIAALDDELASEADETDLDAIPFDEALADE